MINNHKCKYLSEKTQYKNISNYISSHEYVIIDGTNYKIAVYILHTKEK